MLARSSRRATIVEFGTSSASRPCISPRPPRQRRRAADHQRVRAVQGGAARENLGDGGLADLVEIREGDALKTLSDAICPIDRPRPARRRQGTLSGDPDLVESRLRPGAMVVADNADFSPEYLARVRSPAHGYLSIPFSERMLNCQCAVGEVDLLASSIFLPARSAGRWPSLYAGRRGHGQHSYRCGL